MEELLALQENAPAEQECEECEEGPFSGLSQSALCELVDKAMKDLSEACAHPMSHKVAVFYVLQNMVTWHTQMGISQMEEGDTESGVSWLRDAGKFQAMSNILSSISLGPNDFTCEQGGVDEDEE